MSQISDTAHVGVGVSSVGYVTATLQPPSYSCPLVSVRLIPTGHVTLDTDTNVSTPVMSEVRECCNHWYLTTF